LLKIPQKDHLFLEGTGDVQLFKLLGSTYTANFSLVAFAEPPKMQTACAPEKRLRHNSLQTLCTVYSSMNTKLVGEMEKITVFGISLKELQFGGFSTPPKMETTCVPEKCRRHNSLKALFAVYRYVIAKLAGEMEKITGFGIFFGSILIGHLERELPSTHIPHVCKKCFLVLGVWIFLFGFFVYIAFIILRFVWVGVPLLC
jgi:hypothetical protein